MFMETLLCTAVGTARYQHGLEAYNVYGDHTVSSCRYSKTSPCTLLTLHCALQIWVVFKNDKALPKDLSALTELVKCVQGFHLTP